MESFGTEPKVGWALEGAEPIGVRFNFGSGPIGNSFGADIFVRQREWIVFELFGEFEGLANLRGRLLAFVQKAAPAEVSEDGVADRASFVGIEDAEALERLAQ